MAYRFANQSEVKELTACCMKILYAVQDEVSDYFTFDIRLNSERKNNFKNFLKNGIFQAFYSLDIWSSK